MMFKNFIVECSFIKIGLRLEFQLQSGTNQVLEPILDIKDL